MRFFGLALAGLTIGIAPAARSDPGLECSMAHGSQVEIADCVAAAESAVDKAVEAALGFAMNAARDLDGVTGRVVALPALEAGQVAWAAYRDAHCAFAGATFGGGSGTGIAIRSCRVELGRSRVAELLRYAQ